MIVICDTIAFLKGGRYAKYQENSYNRIAPHGLNVAQVPFQRFLDKICQLYGQGATQCRIGGYVKRWWRWVRSGVVLRGWIVVSVFVFLNFLKTLIYNLPFLFGSYFSQCTHC
jgi:hypothetical protein